MKIKNLFLISFFLISSSCFASSKKVTEMDLDRFFSCAPIYNENKNSTDPKQKKLSEYAANLFAQYFALACKMSGDMIHALEVVCQDENTPKELIEKGKAEARAQGILVPNISMKK